MATLTQKVPLTSFSNGATISLPAGITTDARLVLVVAYAAAGLPTGSTSVTIGGNYTAWTPRASNRYRVRRHLEVLLSNGQPTDSWTINCNVVGTTYQQGYYAIYELTSYDGTTPSDTWQEAGGADDAVSSPLAVASVGTIGSGDVVLAVGALEITSAGQSWSTGVTGLESVTDLSDLRNVYIGSTTTDDTPQMEWTGGSSGGYLLAGIFNDGSTATGGDSTAPTLSSPTDAATGSTTGSGSVSTDEGNGTLYWVVTISATSPSAAQVKAGQDHTGSAATDSGSQAVSTTGVQNVSGGFTGLTASTTYYAHFMHEDAATNQSTVSSADGFTTSAAGGAIAAIYNHYRRLRAR